MADLAVGESTLGTAERPSRRLLSPFRWAAATVAAEGERRVLWLPVCLGGGIALYFTLTVEPPLWLGAAVFLPIVIASLPLRRRPAIAGTLVALAFVAAGFALVQAARWERGAPLLDHRLGAVPVSGRVVDVDTLDRGWRVIVASEPLPRLDPGEQPRLVRIHIAASSDPVEPGDTIRMKAMLYPVPAPILPGGRDMQRELYFAGIGGVGYSLGPAHRTGEATAGGWREWLLRVRAEMTRRIGAVLPGSTGGIASALITGKRGTIAEDVKEAFRETGLSHLLAIAGLHLGLVGGFVFLTVRGFLALVPRVALRL